MRPRETGLPHPPDGCPRCVGSFAVVPLSVAAEGPGAVRCQYRCPKCLHSWSCGWSTLGSEDDPHDWPDTHLAAECPCGCGLRLLRQVPAVADGDAA